MLLTLLGVAGCVAPGDAPDTPAPRSPPPPVEETPTAPPPAPETPPPEPEPEPEPGKWLLETDEVRVVELTVGADELASLAVAPEAWVPADLAIDGREVHEIAIRLKGNGSFQPIDQKPSLKLNLDHYRPDNELDGLDELVLNNLVTDASGLRERLAYAAYREVGVPAPRAAHVELVLNGQPFGVYLLLEDVDRRFLERWFPDPDGPLYEMFDVDLTPPEVWQLEHESGPDDRDALVALADVLADEESRVSVDGEPYLDVAQFAAYFGASAVIGQFDAYPYSFPGDDVYLYVDPGDDDRIHFLAHGADETFRDPFRPADYVFGLLAVRCLADVACDEVWTEAVWTALERVEALDLEALRQDWAADVRAALEVDPKQPWTLDEIAADHQALQDFIVTRRERLEAMPGL